jgi:hypothetical protein
MIGNGQSGDVRTAECGGQLFGQSEKAPKARERSVTIAGTFGNEIESSRVGQRGCMRRLSRYEEESFGVKVSYLFILARRRWYMYTIMRFKAIQQPFLSSSYAHVLITC